MHKQWQKQKPSVIQMIRQSLEPGTVLADKLGLSTSTICKIRNGWTYKGVPNATRNVGVSI